MPNLVLGYARFRAFLIAPPRHRDQCWGHSGRLLYGLIAFCFIVLIRYGSVCMVDDKLAGCRQLVSGTPDAHIGQYVARISAIAERPRDALCQLKPCRVGCCTNVRKIPFEKSCNKRRSLKVIGNAAIRWSIYHFLLVVCSNNVYVLHQYGDITTFAVYIILLECHLCRVAGNTV